MIKIRNNNGPKRACELPSEWEFRARQVTDVESEILEFESLMYSTVATLDKFQTINDEDVRIIASNAKILLQKKLWPLFDSCMDFLLSTEYFLNYNNEPGYLNLNGNSNYSLVFPEPVPEKGITATVLEKYDSYRVMILVNHYNSEFGIEVKHDKVWWRKNFNTQGANAFASLFDTKNLNYKKPDKTTLCKVIDHLSDERAKDKAQKDLDKCLY